MEARILIGPVNHFNLSITFNNFYFVIHEVLECKNIFTMLLLVIVYNNCFAFGNFLTFEVSGYF